MYLVKETLLISLVLQKVKVFRVVLNCMVLAGGRRSHGNKHAEREVGYNRSWYYSKGVFIKVKKCREEWDLKE